MKKMKRTLSLIISVVLIISLVPITSYAANKPYKDPELARAVSLGIGSYSESKSITYKDFLRMLDRVVSLGNPSATKQWKQKYPAARKSNRIMKRDEGMLAVFLAAKALGNGYNTTNYDADGVLSLIGEKCWKEMSWDYSLFPGWEKPAKCGNDPWDSSMIAAYFYCMGRNSLYSDKMLFDYDSKGKSMHLSDRLTYQAALLAALRLYDSNLKATDNPDAVKEQQILKAAELRKNTIQNSKTDVSVTGTSYYVSNSGSDSNDGKSPKTAWETMTKVNSMDFREGDGIFFERGSIFRGIFKVRGQITYSAYGEGPKPKIYGSPENGSGEEKWTLMKGSRNIWIFYKELYDTGGIVFNEGKSFANRKTALWNGKKYVDVVDKKTPIDIMKLKNLEFYNPIDYTGYSSEEAMTELDTKGKIYLRCDAGNPGMIYDSIEFLTKDFDNANPRGNFILQASTDCLIDNLCLMYCQSGVSISGNTTIQNCEVGWVGGIVAGFNGTTIGADTAAVIRCGDGILCATGSNNIVKNNYVHHVYDIGLSIETGGWQEDDTRYATDTTIKGNLVEACSGGMQMADFASLKAGQEKLLFKNILIEDNYLMSSGYGWSHQTTDYDWGYASLPNNGNSSIRFAFQPESGKNIQVKDNIFYLSKYALVGADVGGGLKDRHKIIFTGNTYYQRTYGILAEWQPLEGSCYLKKYYCNKNTRKTIMDVLGDKNAILSS